MRKLRFGRQVLQGGANTGAGKSKKAVILSEAKNLSSIDVRAKRTKRDSSLRSD
jgi:hypothetical protein